MATIHISEAEAARDFAALLAQVRGGDEVIIDGESSVVAVLSPPSRGNLSLRERIALMPDDSPAVDDGFAADVQAAIDLHREPLDPPAWD